MQIVRSQIERVRPHVYLCFCKIFHEAWPVAPTQSTRDALTMRDRVGNRDGHVVESRLAAAVREILVSGFDAFARGQASAWPQQYHEQPETARRKRWFLNKPISTG